MTNAKHRWMKFWPQDWSRDPNLRVCSLKSRGFWMEMLCILHESDTPGYLLINGQAPSVKALAVLAGCAVDQAKTCLDELRAAGVFSETDQGVIYNRRMVRDAEYSAKQSAHGKRGGNPTLKGDKNQTLKGSDNGSDGQTLKGCLKVLEAEAESEEEKERKFPPICPPIVRLVQPARSPQAAPRAKQRHRLPDDFWPNQAGIDAAARAGIDQVAAVVEQFRDHHTAKGSLMADWQAAWRTWAGNHRRFTPKAAPEFRNGFLALIAEEGFRDQQPEQTPHQESGKWRTLE